MPIKQEIARWVLSWAAVVNFLERAIEDTFSRAGTVTLNFTL